MYRLLFACLLFCLSAFVHTDSCYAQSAQILIAQSDDIYPSNPDSALKLTQQALVIATKNKDTAAIALAKVKCARYYILKSQFEDAGAYINDAIVLQKKINDLAGLGYSYKLKSILMGRIGNDKESMQLNESAAELYRQSGDSDGMCDILLNLTLDYIDTKNFDLADAALDTIASYTSFNTGQHAYFYFQNRGSLYAAQNEFKLAMLCYDSAIAIANELNMIDSYCTVLALLGETNLKAGDFIAAEKYLLESCSVARKNNLDNELNEALILLTQVYVERKDYQKAYTSQKEQTELSKKLYNIERINKINELEKRLALAEKESELVKKDAEIAAEINEQEKLSRQNILLTIIVSAVAIIALVVVLLFLRTRNLNKRIAGQNIVIAEKSAIAQNALRKITDSISYSKRIQKAMLPELQSFTNCFPESFILYLPKDIVSGDFYWLEKTSDQILFAVADCTGHGVPGAFMSIVGFNHLQQAFGADHLRLPNEILDRVNTGISVALKQNDEAVANDGMDISLCAYFPATKLLKFAGANHALWILRENEIIELKGDAQPIGAYPGQSIRPFTLVEFQLYTGDQLFLFTDGYIDQFGGPKGGKFKHKQLKQLLIDNANLSMKEKHASLQSTIRNWQGSIEQIDDMLIMGITIQ